VHAENDNSGTRVYGVRDASYRAAGGSDGIRRLVERFYVHMESLPLAATIRAMHAADLGEVREKLAVFLCAWLGGPNEYRQKFGPISIPSFHAKFPIDEAERDAWLACMQLAVEEQPWDDAFKSYFMSAIAVPAERCRTASVMRRGET
jgi:hemoglobin